MNFNLSPEQYKKIGEHIEKNVLKIGDRSAALLGAFLLAASLCAFLLSPSTTELSCATGYELAVNHKMVSVILFIIFHIMGILILITPNFPDKFQFATTFTMVSIPLLFFIETNGFKSEGQACQKLPLPMVSFFALMFNWIAVSRRITIRAN